LTAAIVESASRFGRYGGRWRKFCVFIADRIVEDRALETNAAFER
jgi:hypothetical protein